MRKRLNMQCTGVVIKDTCAAYPSRPAQDSKSSRPSRGRNIDWNDLFLLPNSLYLSSPLFIHLL